MLVNEEKLLPCAPKLSGPSTISSGPSAASATCSTLKNAKLTSPPQDTDSIECLMLGAARPNERIKIEADARLALPIASRRPYAQRAVAT
jgi:hypothetical protein